MEELFVEEEGDGWVVGFIDSFAFWVGEWWL
jgi:hypothetical protein